MSSPERTIAQVGGLVSHGESIECHVPAQSDWVPAGIDLEAGETLHITATGTVSYTDPPLLKAHPSVLVGPEGTFEFTDEVTQHRFPLPAAGEGPAPCYCLIGRIGDGLPFFVGGGLSRIAERSGPLFLTINDFDRSDNTGCWRVRIETGGPLQPVRTAQALASRDGPGCPVPNARVVVFYMDGLRPDVVNEMSALGHLPRITSLFLDGGVSCPQTYTVFPSDTITSNGTMWTGCFSDRHGIKGQSRFSRRSLRSDSYLEALGPHRSATTLAPGPVDRKVHNGRAEAIGAIHGEAAENRFRTARVTDVPPIYARLRACGSDWATGILPLMTETPPLLWTRSLVRFLPYFHSHRAWEYIDDANTHYALKELLDRERPVTVIWLPETDSVSHKQRRGQFGMTRRTIARADRLIGEVVDDIAARGLMDRTYFMLVSDHGHHGGQARHLAHYDLAHSVFYEPRQLTHRTEWVGGGLGLSVRQHRSWSRHPEHNSRSFVYLDANSDGVARVFLPRDHFRSGRWVGGPNAPGRLFAYPIAPNRPAVNLVEHLLSRVAQHPDGTVGSPIDLVLLAIDENSVLIGTSDRGYAMIQRRVGNAGRFEYRYVPVAAPVPQPNGSLDLHERLADAHDPLEIGAAIDPETLTDWRDETEWLRITSRTRYPDSVVVLSRHMLWQSTVRHRREEYAPDLIVTARPGWYFGHNTSPGTMHGYPFRDSMTASWFLAGPNLRRGAILHDPVRTIDLAPTILHMAGYPHDGMDGRPLRSIYRFGPESQSEPVLWSDVDLMGWQGLRFAENPTHPLVPKSVNRPEKWLDLNNVVRAAVTAGDVGVVRLLDTAVFPFRGGNGPLVNSVDDWDQKLRRSRWHTVSDTARVLNFPGAAVGDYTETSLGNLRRASDAIDWTQARLRGLGSAIARPFGDDHVPGSRLFDRGVDSMQAGVWELYRFGQRVAVQVLDESVLNGVEDTLDRGLNRSRQTPEEVFIDSPQTPLTPQTAAATAHERMR